jgi:sterol desaturase/sphingolipid hydroxylase (fatty acid hydroxylase superfamily)
MAFVGQPTVGVRCLFNNQGPLFTHIQHPMSLILYAIPFFLALMAIEMVVAKKRGKAVYRFHDAITSLNIGFVSETIRSLAKLLSIVVYALLVDQVAAFTWDVKNPAVWIVAFFMYDFFYYWAHRSGHEVNLLWASHVVHHSSEDFNLATAFRQSWTNQFFYWMFYLPMAIAGIPVTVFAITALMSAVYQFWVHTQLIRTMGWADRVLVTPSNHRVHHGRNDYCIDRNYGGTLILWDRLFGTYAAERPDEPVVYGTLKPLNSWSPLWGNLKNFAGIYRDALATRGWRNRLMVVFAPPGWTPADAPVHNTTPWDGSRFETASTRWQQRYGVMATLVILVLALDLLTSASGMSMALRLTYTAAIVASTACLARLFENKPGALRLETLRTALLLGPLVAGVWFHPVGPAARAAAAAALLLCLWGLALQRPVLRQTTTSAERA